jgi:hypothetical protein
VLPVSEVGFGEWGFSIEQVEAAARQALSPEAQAAAWAAGQAMTMEEAIAEALSGANED